jgi:GTPase SAR1 family protein
MLNYYSKTKADLEHILKELGDIAVSENSKTKTQLICDKLKADVFSLVVVGQFKRGKTTFINALLGKDFLPTAIIPLTSIITILKYGVELKINVFFENNNRKDISVDELKLYVTEKHNPKNEKGVDRVEIFYPSDYLKNGVQIIDTPGVASVHEHNTKTTYEYLPNADVAVFLISVDPPITQAELHFLKDIKNLVVKTFFIQNMKNGDSHHFHQKFPPLRGGEF